MEKRKKKKEEEDEEEEEEDWRPIIEIKREMRGSSEAFSGQAELGWC